MSAAHLAAHHRRMLETESAISPEVIARASNFIGYANANRTATPLVDTAISGNPAIYPDPETRQRLHSTRILPPKLERRRSRTWTKIKTGL